MLTRILHNSPKLCAFAEPLLTNLSEPQRRHLLDLADALLVCEEKKTLAALQRQFIASTDASNWADFLRISPWSAAAVKGALRQQQIAWALAQAAASGAAKELYLNLDDSIGEKDAQTWRLEPVDWFHDHQESTPKQQRYKKGFCYLACTLRVGEIVVTLDVRLYLRARTVRALNRDRATDQRLKFRSKNSLAKIILSEVAPLLPKDWDVMVQFDSWYASAKLLKFVRRQHWHFTCGLKSNRTLNGKRLDQHARELRYKWHTRINVTTAEGKTIYYVRQLTGQVQNVPVALRILFSKRHPWERFPAYFASTRLTCTAQAIMQGSSSRWSCEVVNFYLKTHLGLADFRVRSDEAVDKYMVAVHLAWAYVERRYVEERGAQIQTYGDLIRRHRDEHAELWLTGALEMLLAGHSKEEVLQRFLRLEPAA